jgi:hypothetical protein
MAALLFTGTRLAQPVAGEFLLHYVRHTAVRPYAGW